MSLAVLFLELFFILNATHPIYMSTIPTPTFYTSPYWSETRPLSYAPLTDGLVLV